MSREQWGHGYYAGVAQAERDSKCYQEMAASKAADEEQVRLWELTIRGKIFRRYCDLWSKKGWKEGRIFWAMVRVFGFRWR